MGLKEYGILGTILNFRSGLTSSLDQAWRTSLTSTPGRFDDPDAGKTPTAVADNFQTMQRTNMDRICFENSMMSLSAGMPSSHGKKECLHRSLARQFPLRSQWKRRLHPFLHYQFSLGSSSLQRHPLASSSVGMFAKHVRALCNTEYRQAMDLKWTRALASWMIILESSNFESLVGSYVLEKLTDGNRDEGLTYIRDACDVRSPNTVLRSGNERAWWPLHKRSLLDFLSACEAEGRSKFIGKNLMHAVKFFKQEPRIHKTSTSAEKKALYLPFVAPINGVGSECWALAWTEALEQLGLLRDREPYGPMTSVGGFTKRPLTTDEISPMINGFLDIAETDEATSFHSWGISTQTARDPSEAVRKTSTEGAASEAAASESLQPSPSLAGDEVTAHSERKPEMSDTPAFDPATPLKEKVHPDAEFDEAGLEDVEARVHAAPISMRRYPTRGIVQSAGRDACTYKDVFESTVSVMQHEAAQLVASGLRFMRRLVFEAQTSLIAQSRAFRITNQRARLTGLNLEGPMEVAYSLYDIVSGMMQADALRYLHPSKCITRMQEITMTKPPKELRQDATGQGIMVKDVQGDQQCQVSTELDVMEAMTRRSLAFDVVGLVNYEVFQKWVNQQHRPDSNSPTSPSSSVPTDKDSSFEKSPQDHTVMYYMLPTQAQATQPKPKPKAEPKKERSAWEGGNKGTYKASSEPWKNKASAKTYPSGGKLPLALKGCVSCLPDGSRLYFAFNMNGCDKAQPGESCEKGWHICATKGCGGNHPHS
eukprot:s528_g14.t1